MPLCKQQLSVVVQSKARAYEGDFSYGLFVLHREDGRSFRILRAADNEVWEFVEARLGPSSRKAVKSRRTMLQEVVARLADRSEGRSFTMAMVCPYCQSRHFRDRGGSPVPSAEIAEAAFQSFTSLDHIGKERLIKTLERQIRAERGEGDSGPSDDDG